MLKWNDDSHMARMIVCYELTGLRRDATASDIVACLTANPEVLGEVTAELGLMSDDVALQQQAALIVAERERDEYKRAKEENDERFMTERDQARQLVSTAFLDRDALRYRIAKLEAVAEAARRACSCGEPTGCGLCDALHALDEDSGGSGAAHSPTAMERPGVTARDDEVRGRFACGCEVSAHKYGWVLTVCHQYSNAISMIRAGYAIAASHGVGPWAKKALEDSGGSA